VLALPHAVLTEGMYAWVMGLGYETRAEARLLHAAGVDVMGMSTVLEVLFEREVGVQVRVLSSKSMNSPQTHTTPASLPPLSKRLIYCVIRNYLDH